MLLTVHGSYLVLHSLCVVHFVVQLVFLLHSKCTAFPSAFYGPTVVSVQRLLGVPYIYMWSTCYQCTAPSRNALLSLSVLHSSDQWFSVYSSHASLHSLSVLHWAAQLLPVYCILQSSCCQCTALCGMYCQDTAFCYLFAFFKCIAFCDSTVVSVLHSVSVMLGRVAQSVGHLTRKSGVLGSAQEKCG